MYLFPLKQQRKHNATLLKLKNQDQMHGTPDLKNITSSKWRQLLFSPVNQCKYYYK